MQAILMDGEAKSGKTTVGNAIREALITRYQVHSAVAGSFYRRLTVLALELHGGTYDRFDTSWLEGALRSAVASDIAYDNNRDWSAINTELIDELVSRGGQYDFMQAAGREWWRKTADIALAQGADVLLVDGRNPRAKLAEWRKAHTLPIALDLCIHCDVRVAGERYLHGQGVDQPADEQLTAAIRMIQERRTMDRNRQFSPYVEPADQLQFVPGEDSIQKIIEESFASSVSDPPRPIGLDTSGSTVEMTRPVVASLALTALTYQKM